MPPLMLPALRPLVQPARAFRPQPPAAMLDPHTSSELSMDDIVKLCDDLFEAHGDMLPGFD